MGLIDARGLDEEVGTLGLGLGLRAWLSQKKHLACARECFYVTPILMTRKDLEAMGGSLDHMWARPDWRRRFGLA